MLKVTKALISVSDKTGIVDFARKLKDMEVDIVSTGGTARLLEENSIEVEKISNITRFPEMLDGRVKTLHPAIFGGILALRNEDHTKQLRDLGISPIDMVVVNLYPFDKLAYTLGHFMEGKEFPKGADESKALENIDIGGVTLIRAAAKNYRDVAVIIEPDDYDLVLEDMAGEGIRVETLRNLALKAIAHTARYDSQIYHHLYHSFNPEAVFPEQLLMASNSFRTLRYGENPHQKSMFYSIYPGIAEAEQLNGKKLSFNNFLDVHDAYSLVCEFQEPTVVEMKHTNPCGVATAKNLLKAYELAHKTDPLSAFGGIIAVNRPLDLATAEKISEVFMEVIIAPEFEQDALDLLCKKKNLRLLKMPIESPKGFEMKWIHGGVLLQENDTRQLDMDELKVVTEREPTEQELRDLQYAWKITKHVKSNSIVFCKENRTVGIGAGQMSRVDAVWIAREKSHGNSKGAVMASDAFFPFRDGIDEAAKGGITAVIQPGGSIRDQEGIDAANEHDMAMVFTGYRIFKH